MERLESSDPVNAHKVAMAKELLPLPLESGADSLFEPNNGSVAEGDGIR